MDPITIAGIGMQNDLQRMNTISQNLANVATHGYKSQITVTRPFEALLGEAFAAEASVGSSMLANQHVTANNIAGTLRKTGNPLDLAIDGQGYFEVQSEKGMAYTRQGEMHLDSRGRLVTNQDMVVMGTVGELVANGNTALSVGAKGEIMQGDRSIGQIKLVHFSNRTPLISMGNGLFSQGSAELGDQGVVGFVRSGYQENSNVDSSHEMVNLTETMRHFETMQKVIQGYDDLYEKTIRKLGEF